MGRTIVDELSEEIQIDAEGRVIREVDGAPSNWLEGSWRLLPAGPALGLLIREDGAELPPEPTRAILAADLSAVACADLAVFLSQGRFSGVLFTRSGGVERTLSFRSGKLCWATSTEPAERLGEVALRHGLISRDALEQVRDRFDLDPGGRKLGGHIVEAKVMNFHDLWRAIQLQVQEIFFSLMVAASGAFAFIDAKDDPSLESNVALDTQGLLIEGARRADEMKLFRKLIPSSAVTPRRIGRALPDTVSLSEKRVYPHVNGSRSMIELGMASGLGEFEATKALHHLLELGLVAVEAPIRERTPTPGAMDAAVLIATYNLVLHEVFAALVEAWVDAPFRISMDSFLLSEAKAQPLLAGTALEGGGTLPEMLLLERVAHLPGLAGAAAVKPALEAVVSFALFQAREILDGPTADALARRARTLVSG